MQSPTQTDTLNANMDENYSEANSKDKWLDVGRMFEDAANQQDDDLQLAAVGRSQETDIGGIGDVITKNPRGLFEDNESNAWQKFQDTLIKDDLASVFQNELELQNVAPGLNEWRATPDVPVESNTTEFEVTENGPNEEVFSAISFSLKPLSKKQFLNERMKENLRNWIPVICDQYNWQLDWLSLRPTQMMWKLHDFPESLIRDMFEIIRKRTSERLFQVFPELRGENSSEDFWSPGYFIDAE